jgi:hypothetical protein
MEAFPEDWNAADLKDFWERFGWGTWTEIQLFSRH